MTYRELLARNPDFRRLWTGQLISEIGDWFNNIAVLALCLDLAGHERQGLAMAIYATARHLPMLLFNPLAGVVADRFNRRQIMIAADLSRALLALGFLIAERWRSLPLIYSVGACLFAISTFFNAAKKSALPNIVGDTEELLGANALSASTTAATLAIGSACGGLIASVFGRGVVFVINAATFLLSAEMIRRVRARTSVHNELEAKPPLTREGKYFRSLSHIFRRVASDFWLGIGYVRHSKILRVIFIVAAGWGLGNGVARALYSIFGARLGERELAGLVRHPTDFGISLLFVAMGVGGVLGAPLARRFNSASRERLGSRMGRSLILDGCGLALFSLMPNLWSASLLLIAREMNFAVWWTAQQTIMMTTSEDRFRGRVFASYETALTLMMVSSILIAGASADWYGIRPVAAAGGLVIVFSGLLWFLLKGDK